MRIYFLIISVIALSFTWIGKSFSADVPKNNFRNAGIRKSVSIDKGWRFHEGDVKDAQLPEFDASGWKQVDVPHDWRIHDQYSRDNSRLEGYLPRGIGWYRKQLDISPSYAGLQVYVSFDGVFRNYTVWVNGKKAGTHLSGYTGFVVDITKLLDFHSGHNVMAVLVDNVNPNKYVKPHSQSEYGPGHEGWWYEGYGIYRHVNLIITSPVHVSTWGTFAYTEDVSRESAVVKIKTNITDNSHRPHELVINTSIFDPDGRRLKTVSKACKIKADDTTSVFQKSVVLNPQLWSPAHPRLYKIVTEIVSDGIVCDNYETPLGIRWFRFTPDSGFFLNGKHLQLRGMNIHAGFGGLGTALPDRANYRDVELARKMGCNIIRSAHHDPSPSLMEACDKLGMLLWAETRYLGSDSFAIKTLQDMIRRDRNHPSIICWSLANNSGRNNTALTKMLQVMNTYAKKEDPTRPTAFGSEANGDPNKTGFAFVTDIMGYNGGGMGRDDPDHHNYPDRKMLISEYSSGRGTRGNYKRKVVGRSLNEKLGDGRIVRRGSVGSIYDLCLSHEKEWKHVAQRPFLAGGLMWSGIEYLGESSGWPVVTSQFGVLDVCRFKKDAYYYYLQEWTGKPMVHIFPHWNWSRRDSVIDVWCYSNCDEVELFLNGKSLGIKKKVPLGHMEWKVPFYPGVLKAKGYKKGLGVVAESRIQTAGPPDRLHLSADRTSVKADGKDLTFITIDVCDRNGIIVPDANNNIEVKVKNGKLLGLCSGNPMNHEDPAMEKMNAFNGKLLAIVQSYDKPGDIRVETHAKGLLPGLIIIHAK